MLQRFFNNAPELKTNREIALMAEAGKVVAEAHHIIRGLIKPGVRTIEIDKAVEDLFRRRGAISLFKGYDNGTKVPFPGVTCISINEQVVHGIPGKRPLRDGDLVKIDTACKLNGWCADAARSHFVGRPRPEWKRMVQVGWETLDLAIREMGQRRWWSEVAARMEQHVKKAGFGVVTSYVGHGIGRIMHESPQVPNFLGDDFHKHDFKLEEGLVLAIEPMVCMGKGEVDTAKDSWTVVTRDRMPSVHVEHTVAITSRGVEILTPDFVPAAKEPEKVAAAP